MGIGISHTDWYSSWRGYRDLINRLAVAAGYTISKKRLDWEGEGGGKRLSGSVEIDSPDWDNTDPLCSLANPHDIEEYPEAGRGLYPNEAKLLAERLEQLLPELVDAVDRGEEDQWYLESTVQIIAGLRDAVARGEEVWFD